MCARNSSSLVIGTLLVHNTKWAEIHFQWHRQTGTVCFQRALVYLSFLPVL